MDVLKITDPHPDICARQYPSTKLALQARYFAVSCILRALTLQTDTLVAKYELSSEKMSQELFWGPAIERWSSWMLQDSQNYFWMVEHMYSLDAICGQHLLPEDRVPARIVDKILSAGTLLPRHYDRPLMFPEGVKV